MVAHRCPCAHGQHGPARGPSTQMRVYQHFEDPLEAKKLFANLTDAKTHEDRLDEHDEDRGHLMVDAMREWESS